jgi:hypothetical protein
MVAFISRIHQDAVAGQPYIGQLCGSNDPVAEDIPGQQLGVESGLKDSLRLGRVLIANHIDQGQRGQRLDAGAIGLADARIRVAKQRAQVDGVGSIGPSCLSRRLIQAVHVPENEDGGQSPH